MNWQHSSVAVLPAAGYASMSSWASSSESSPPLPLMPRISFMLDLMRGIMVFNMLWKRPGKRFSCYASISLMRWRSFGALKHAGQLSVMTGSLTLFEKSLKRPSLQ